MPIPTGITSPERWENLRAIQAKQTTPINAYTPIPHAAIPPLPLPVLVGTPTAAAVRASKMVTMSPPVKGFRRVATPLSVLIAVEKSTIRGMLQRFWFTWKSYKYLKNSRRTVDQQQLLATVERSGEEMSALQNRLGKAIAREIELERLLEKQTSTHTQETSTMEVNYNQLQQELTQLKETLSTATTSFGELEEDLASMESAKSKVDNHNTQLTSEIISLRTELETKEQNLAAVCDSTEKSEQRAEALNSELTNMRSQLETISNDHHNLQVSENSLRREHETVKSQHSAITTVMERLSEGEQSLKDQVSALLQEVTLLKNQHSSEINNLETTISDLRRSRDQQEEMHKARMQFKDQEATQQVQTLTLVSDREASLLGQVSELKQCINTLEHERRDLISNQAIELSKAASSTTDNVLKLQKRLGEATADIAEGSATHKREILHLNKSNQITEESLQRLIISKQESSELDVIKNNLMSQLPISKEPSAETQFADELFPSDTAVSVVAAPVLASPPGFYEGIEHHLSVAVGGVPPPHAVEYLLSPHSGISSPVPVPPFRDVISVTPEPVRSAAPAPILFDNLFDNVREYVPPLPAVVPPVQMLPVVYQSTELPMLSSTQQLSHAIGTQLVSEGISSPMSQVGSVIPLPVPIQAVESSIQNHVRVPSHLTDHRSVPMELKISTPAVPSASGSYVLSGVECPLRGLPVWTCGEKRLFAGTGGRWLIGACQASVDKNRGCIRSTSLHSNRLPHHIEGWETADGKGGWTPTFIQVVSRGALELTSLWAPASLSLP